MKQVQVKQLILTVEYLDENYKPHSETITMSDANMELLVEFGTEPVDVGFNRTFRYTGKDILTLKAWGRAHS